MSKRKPRELLAALMEELEDLRVAIEQQGDIADCGEWATPLISASTQFLRDLADFRDGIQEAMASYPEVRFDEVASPDLEDPDLVVWHELTEWFAEHTFLAETDFEGLDDDPLP